MVVVTVVVIVTTDGPLSLPFLLPFSIFPPSVQVKPQPLGLRVYSVTEQTPEVRRPARPSSRPVGSLDCRSHLKGTVGSTGYFFRGRTTGRPDSPEGRRPRPQGPPVSVPSWRMILSTLGPEGPWDHRGSIPPCPAPPTGTGPKSGPRRTFGTTPGPTSRRPEVPVVPD